MSSSEQHLAVLRSAIPPPLAAATRANIRSARRQRLMVEVDSLVDIAELPCAVSD
jgi:hypothetical protein